MKILQILASQMTKRAAPIDVNWQLDPSLQFHRVYLEAETTFSEEFDLIAPVIQSNVIRSSSIAWCHSLDCLPRLWFTASVSIFGAAPS